MCFDRDSLPPIPVISGAAVSHDELVLEARDGNRLAAFAATPDEPGGAGVVILPDIRGLYRFYEELALRFAERGSRGDRDRLLRAHCRRRRSATTSSSTGRTWSRRRRRASRPTPPRASSALREGAEARAVFTVGFCFGGRHSWLAAAGGHGLAGAIGFYGRPGPGATAHPGRPSGPASSGADPRADGRRRRRHPGRTGRGVRVGARRRPASSTRSSIYDGAPHSFFDRKQEEFADASADAWSRVLAFIELYSSFRQS